MASPLLLAVVIGLAGVLAWAPVVADLREEFQSLPPHARRRQRSARHRAGPRPEVAVVREHSPTSPPT